MNENEVNNLLLTYYILRTTIIKIKERIDRIDMSRVPLDIALELSSIIYYIDEIKKEV